MKIYVALNPYFRDAVVKKMASLDRVKVLVLGDSGNICFYGIEQFQISMMFSNHPFKFQPVAPEQWVHFAVGQF